MLNKNLKALKKVNQDFHNWIINDTDNPDWFEVIKENILVKEGAKRIHMYSLDDPHKEAAKMIEGMDLYKQDVSIVIGIGLGFLLNQLKLKKEKEHRIVIIEPTPKFIKLAFSNYDFSEEIENKTMIFIKPERDWIIEVLATFESFMVVNKWYLTIEHYARTRIEYMKLTNIVSELINQFNCNIGTVMNAGAVIADNDIISLPYTIKHRGVAEIKDLFKGKPCVTVSTGPSLQKNIHVLKENQDRVIIVAVGQALRILLAYDIRPDFICTVDFGETNMVHYEGLLDSDVPLVALNRTYAPLLKKYKGPKFIVATPNPGLENKAVGILSEKGALDQGGSVAHLCLSFAQHLGCDPVIMIGQDLALSDNKSHNPQADVSGDIEIDENSLIQWKVKDPASKLHGQKYSMGPMITVEGYFGIPVLTNIGLGSFITAFENLIRVSNTVVINATEGGCHIKGTKRMSLASVMEKYAKIINKSDLDPYLSYADNGDKLIEKVIPLLQEDIKLFSKIISSTDKGLKTVKNLYRFSQRKKIGPSWEKAIKKEFNKNRKYSKQSQEYATQAPLVSLAIYGATRTIQTRELMVNPSAKHLIKNKDDLKIRIDRNNLILKAANKAAKKLLKSYKETLSILTKYSNTNDLNLLISNPRIKVDLDNAKYYLDKDNFAKPLLDARRILKKDPENEQAKRIETASLILRERLIDKAKNEYGETDKLLEYNNLIENAQLLGRERKDYKKAANLIKEAVKLYPEKEIGLYGLATVSLYIDDYEMSLAAYKRLIREHPDKLDYRFEYGQALIEADKPMEGLKEIEAVMLESRDYDGFLSIMGDMYFKFELYDQALTAYNLYLEKFPADYKVWIQKGKVLKKLDRLEEAEKAELKAESLL